MSAIVLSASVRQNLLSLQSTAELLSTTQSRLSTGKKVNTALDNPTNYFTAASLDSRASDINNLLDGIGNGVQVLQAANTGITSLQKLVDSAKSVANQALQTQVGYSTKSQFTSAAIAGATANNLLGTASAGTAGTLTAGAFTALDVSGAGSAATAGTVTAGAFSGPIDISGTGSAATAATAFTGTGFSNLDVTAGSASFTLNVDGTSQAITIDAAAVTAYNGAGGALTATALSATDVANLINYQFSGGTFPAPATPATVVGGELRISSGTTGASSQVTITGFAEAGLTAGGTGLGNINNTGSALVAADQLSFTLTIDSTPTTITLNASTIGTYNTANPTATVNAASLSAADIASVINYQAGGTYASVSGGNLVFTSGSTGTSSSVQTSAVTSAGTPTGGSLGIVSATNTGSALVAADSLTFNVTIDGGSANAVTISAATVATYNTANPTATINAASLSATDVASLINSQLPGTTNYATVSGGALVFTSGSTGASSSIATSAVTTAGTVTGSTGVTAATNTGVAGTTPLGSLVLTIGATGNGTASSITFGTGSGEVDTLDELNAALAPNNLQASISTTGQITIITSNDASSYTIGAIGGTATNVGNAFNTSTVAAPVQDAAAQLTRANLVSQYNNIIQQITTTSQDSSFNGINLLAGDTLKLVFNETGKSTLSITGVTFNPAGLGLSTLTSGTDFIDNLHTNTILTSLNNASSMLRSQASALGSNLSIVQIRQDFSKNLINVLQTGSSNLTLADTNEEAANSQALSTRQSIAVSALALANQSQQSVLQLLR